jgi:putative hydrolase of the HAD superfamily
MPPKAVFFDAGETLVHPEPSFPELFQRVLREEGLEASLEEVRAQLHVIAERFTRAAEAGEVWSTADRSRGWWSEVYREYLAALGLPHSAALADRLYATFTDHANYRAFPDVVPTLERLHEEGLTLAVISNFEEWLEGLLETLDLVRFFDVRVISGVEGVEKPDPRIFLIALERTGFAPEDAVYVGDSVEFDVAPARALGMTGVLIDRRGRHPDHEGPRLGSLDELPALLGL